MNAPKLLLCLSLALLLSACDLFNPGPLDVPANYDGSQFDTNAAEELALASQLNALTNEMKKGRTAGYTFSDGQLAAFFNATPSLADLSTASYRARVDLFLAEMKAASGGEFDPAKAPDGNGGTYGGYLFDETGLELEQMVEKGLFGALLYYRAFQLLEGELDETTTDRVLALFGAYPTFRNSDNTTLHSDADRFMAKYAARRDPNDGSGFYYAIRQNLIQLQAAIPVADDYPTELSESILAIQQNWERANAATVINYLYATIDGLSQTNPTDAQIASALHAYSEGVGFLSGWHSLPEGSRIIATAKLESILELLLAPVESASTSYLLVQNAFQVLPNLEDAIAELQSTYGFSEAQMTSFRKNWVSEQGR